MEDLRRRYNERVQYLENEWEKEVERLKEMHSSSIKKLTEQHEQDLSRIRRIKEQEIESVNALQNHGSSLESLLSKWEKSAQQIEELHRSVITKQEEILKEKFTDIEHKNKRLDDVELNWHSLINELEKERNRCTDEQKKLYDIIEGQKLLLQTEQKRINEELLELENDKKKLAEEKHKFEIESNYARDSIKKETHIFNEERIKLKDEIMKIELQKKQLVIQEIECKQDLQKERDEINKMFRDIEDKRSELHREQSQLQRLSMSLQSEQHNFEQRKIMFDIEKVKMQDLALEIAKRAEELESLSEIALHEKREGNLAMDEADKFKKELDSKLEFIENSFAQLRKDEDRINREKIKVQEEWKVIKETKDTIVCNLCGSGLNRG
jgi:chromosome segregation ATPase